jgi:hypothetical protein
MDYRFTTMKGLFSNQLLNNNQTYGFDMPMIYGELYFPWVAEGMILRVGPTTGGITWCLVNVVVEEIEDLDWGLLIKE